MTKTYPEFTADMEWASHNLWLAEQKKKKKSDLAQRMTDAHQKKQRAMKIKKLAAISSHWEGLS